MLKALAILFALFGIYSLYVVVSGQGYLYVIGAALALVAAVGLWLRKPWSQYVVYLFSAANIVELVWLTFRAMQNNFWPYASMLQNIIAFVPAALFIVFSLSLSFVAYRGFRDQS